MFTLLSQFQNFPSGHQSSFKKKCLFKYFRWCHLFLSLSLPFLSFFCRSFFSKRVSQTSPTYQFHRQSSQLKTVQSYSMNFNHIIIVPETSGENTKWTNRKRELDITQRCPLFVDKFKIYCTTLGQTLNRDFDSVPCQLLTTFPSWISVGLTYFGFLMLGTRYMHSFIRASTLSYASIHVYLRVCLRVNTYIRATLRCTQAHAHA